MRKRIFLAALLLFLGSGTCTAFAQTDSPTPTPTTTATPTAVSQSQKILNALQNSIASEAAKNPSEKRGVIGTVTDIATTHLSLTDLRGNTQIVDVSDLTKFSAPNAGATFGISDITKGMTVGVLGHYYKNTQRITAFSIDVLTLPKILHGVITDVDKTNFNITVATEDGKKTVVSIENVTKTFSYTKTDGMAKAGFSKFSVGQNCIVVGFPDAHNKNQIVASRVFFFPDLPSNPKINIPTPTVNPSVTILPSTGSGKKLTPITQ